MPDEIKADSAKVFTPDNKILNQDVAHLAANILDLARHKEGIPDELRYGYFDAHSDDIGTILAADAIVDLEHTVADLEDSNKRDDLTGLPKFKALALSFEELRGRVVKGKLKGFGIVYADLDNFSWINDIFEAHSFGNLYLVHAARVLLEYMRATDVVFRRSGDEFAMLLPNFLDTTQLYKFVDRMQKNMRGVVLQHVFTTILQATRTMVMPDGIKERQGVYVVRELYMGLQNLQRNKDGRKDHFKKNGRGNDEYKKELLLILDNINLDLYRNLIEIKSTVDLNPTEYEVYEQLEIQFLRRIQPLFSRLSMSMGGLVVTRRTHGDFETINNKADRMVYQVKRKGGDQVAIGD